MGEGWSEGKFQISLIRYYNGNSDYKRELISNLILGFEIFIVYVVYRQLFVKTIGVFDEIFEITGGYRAI